MERQAPRPARWSYFESEPRGKGWPRDLVRKADCGQVGSKDEQREVGRGQKNLENQELIRGLQISMG